MWRLYFFICIFKILKNIKRYHWKCIQLLCLYWRYMANTNIHIFMSQYSIPKILIIEYPFMPAKVAWTCLTNYFCKINFLNWLSMVLFCWFIIYFRWNFNFFWNYWHIIIISIKITIDLCINNSIIKIDFIY